MCIYLSQTLHGTAIYADQLGWLTGGQCRHIWQSGAYRYYYPVKAGLVWSRRHPAIDRSKAWASLCQGGEVGNRRLNHYTNTLADSWSLVRKHQGSWAHGVCEVRKEMVAIAPSYCLLLLLQPQLVRMMLSDCPKYSVPPCSTNAYCCFSYPVLVPVKILILITYVSELGCST